MAQMPQTLTVLSFSKFSSTSVFFFFFFICSMSLGQFQRFKLLSSFVFKIRFTGFSCCAGESAGLRAGVSEARL